jgi:hypothetical protein
VLAGRAKYLACEPTQVHFVLPGNTVMITRRALPRKPSHHLVDEPNRGLLVAGVVDLQGPYSSGVVNGRELVEAFRRPRDALQELHADLRSMCQQAVPPQNPVDRTIVDVCALEVKLAYPVGNATKGPSSVRLVTCATIAAHISRRTTP